MEIHFQPPPLTPRLMPGNSAVTNKKAPRKRKRVLILNHYTNASGKISEERFKEYAGSLASSRIQLRPCFLAAKELNYDCTIHSLGISEEKNLNENIDYDACIIGKLNADNSKLLHNITISHLAVIARLKRKGTFIITLYSDNHIQRNTKIGELYKDLLFYADLIVCPTNCLKNFAIKHTNHKAKVVVIEDPWSVKSNTYKRKDNPFLQVAWFGSGTNIPYLLRELPDLLNRTNINKPIIYSILTNQKYIRILKEFSSTIKLNRKQAKLKFIAWDINNQPKQLENLLQISDFALIPSDPNDLMKSGVSHNRLVDASRSGCIPLASPMKSYMELQKIAIIGTNFPKMLEFAYQNKDRLIQKYETLRDPLIDKFSPAKNLHNWKHILQAALDSESDYLPH